ncbi:MAG: hypothetical protein LQ346_006523 [Caloplaca aetnensis]|nr:MAG: hypothetical protein LQ346_006523 [Caloplaca aetnensis]
MHFLAYILCTASLVAAAPSKHLLPGVSIQINFEEKYKSQAVQALASLPDQFELEAISDTLDGAPFGAKDFMQNAPLTTAQKTIFRLQDSKIVMDNPFYEDDFLAVGVSPVRVFPPFVALLSTSSEDAFVWEVVAKIDGLYLEMTRDTKQKFGELMETGRGGRVEVYRGGDREHVLRLKVRPANASKGSAVQPLADLPAKFEI